MVDGNASLGFVALRNSSKKALELLYKVTDYLLGMAL